MLRYKRKFSCERCGRVWTWGLCLLSAPEPTVRMR